MSKVKTENQKLNLKYKASFTLVELMIVIAILAILSAIVIFTLNPGRLFDNFRDTRRVTDITSIHKAINFMETWNTSMTYGTSTFVYISIPAVNSNCSDIAGLPTLPAGYTYACSSQANYKKTDGTGWIPINFTVSSDNRYLSNLPVDPVNDNTYFYTYFPGGSYELTTLLKNPNANSINSEGSMTGAFTIGSPNRTKETPLSRDTNLIGHWKFDEGSGTTAYDSSGYGNHGTLTNGPTWTTLSLGNKALNFVGANDYVRFSYQATSRNALTCSIWLKRATGFDQAADVMLLSPSGAWLFYDAYNSGDIYADVFIDTVRKGRLITPVPFDGNWYNVVYTYDSATQFARIYRNGMLLSSIKVTGLSNYLIDSATGPIRDLGHNDKGRGVILDDARIYSRALSADEISQIYNTTKSRYQ